MKPAATAAGTSFGAQTKDSVQMHPTETAANISPCITGKIPQLLNRSYSPHYSLVFPAALTLAHRALAAAETAALQAALLFILAFFAGLAAGALP
jgi:hypothetical protein